MKDSKVVLIDPEETREIVKNLKTGFIIVSGPDEQACGTLPDMDTLFVWTSREKAEAFIAKNDLDPKEDKIIEQLFDELCINARKIGFSNLRFDFTAAGTHPQQQFLNMKLPKRVADLSISELLEIFNKQ